MANASKTSGINPKVTASKSPTPSKTKDLNPKTKVNPSMKKGGKMC